MLSRIASAILWLSGIKLGLTHFSKQLRDCLITLAVLSCINLINIYSCLNAINSVKKLNERFK